MLRHTGGNLMASFPALLLTNGCGGLAVLKNTPYWPVMVPMVNVFLGLRFSSLTELIHTHPFYATVSYKLNRHTGDQSVPPPSPVRVGAGVCVLTTDFGTTKKKKKTI